MAPTSVEGRVRAEIWRAALAADRAGWARVTEVRASDYVGRGALAPFTLMAAPQVLASQPARFPAGVDAPHGWTYTDHVARTLVAAHRC